MKNNFDNSTLTFYVKVIPYTYGTKFDVRTSFNFSTPNILSLYYLDY